MPKKRQRDHSEHQCHCASGEKACSASGSTCCCKTVEPCEHRVSPLSIQIAFGGADSEGVILDVECLFCGRRGSVLAHFDDVRWGGDKK